MRPWRCLAHNLRDGGQSPLIDQDEGERLTKSYIGGHSLVGKGRGGRTTRWSSFDDAGIDTTEILPFRSDPVATQQRRDPNLAAAARAKRAELKRIRCVEGYMEAVVCTRLRGKPAPPQPLADEIAKAGGVQAWIDGNRVIQKAFERVYDRVIATYKTGS